ncbi:hypothetical protein [Nonomuraea guangzhouensis]|uniref:Uncharacterized protein n=1 Tax=Nonomuraea guangzhouensis TaxID=1291555 RepID=A0ABW4GL20_9ACTN
MWSPDFRPLGSPVPLLVTGISVTLY